jgi:FtsP/CotA-like multicopper oxidase with cupredoxin domain
MPGKGGQKDCVVVDPEKIPETGATRKYDFTISYRDIYPDGVRKPGVVVNGGFPGPTIEANWGDWIEVTVHNELDNEGATIHWHGLLQSGTQFMDGIPSVGQCPISPGKTFVYKFRADSYGTTWVSLLIPHTPFHTPVLCHNEVTASFTDNSIRQRIQ